VKQNEETQDEKAENKPVFQMIDKFSLFSQVPHFDIQHLFTMILSQTLDFFYHHAKVDLLEM